MKIKAVQELDPSKAVSFIHLLKDIVRRHWQILFKKTSGRISIPDRSNRFGRFGHVPRQSRKDCAIFRDRRHNLEINEDVMSHFFAIIIPYAAAIIFLAGIVYKVARWPRRRRRSASPQPAASRGLCLDQKQPTR